MMIQTVTVIGAGQMGSGIAQTLAQNGLQVTLYDIEQAAVTKGIATINSSLTRLAAKGNISEADRTQTIKSIIPSTDLICANRSDLIIEAAPENMTMKKALFEKLDRICQPNAILATNTSSLSITEIASATKRASRVIGMHFMNPVPIMPLVEIIKGLETSSNTYEKIKALTLTIKKTPIEVQDFPGFVSNRILMPMINEAIYTVYEGVAEPEAVDQVMKLGMNHPMGPLTLADFIGLDTCLAIMETLQAGFGDSKYRPCPLLRKYVQAGWLGRKAGRGFYVYSNEKG
ncbi:3-hydroxybutyryl-CoA dehydrogenase [Paenibacillus sp. FSL A5-0031]|uniref:3-hydroxybutyryl-CoA dehydrogenase n=1 Tax=Paenibacillus sp. FSL A5-0031 TaxID=1920420 RepID=UPI00096E6235|nr:3-hydroxybutyryl-CoA dehydrogenase [Paenibacillus sp. FSL A5-0031]OME88459.1 3-hydroxybutyryl-CoA dehydrogenase [Paenibacillus sp. FSL A5-0031]